MGALTRLRNYFLGWWKQKAITYDYFARQFPVDLYGMVPGLTVNTTTAIVAPAWSDVTTYTTGQTVIYSGTYYTSLANGNLNHQPDVSPTWWVAIQTPYYPDFSGDQDGEVYLSNDIPGQQQAWIWQGSSWWPLGSAAVAQGAQGPPGVPFAKYEEDADDPGLYREITGNPFPTAIIWWTSAAKVTKVKELLITRDGNQNPTQIQWKFYSSGVLQRTYTDTITNSGPFEASRSRVIT